MRISPSKAIPLLGIYAFVGFYLLFTLFPLYWMIVTSLKGFLELFAYPPIWFPRKPDLGSYAVMLQERSFLVLIKNTFVVSILTMLSCLVIAIPGAYALTRMKVSKKIEMTGAVIIFLGSIFPPIAAVIPLFLTLSKLGFYNNLQTLVMLYTAFNAAFAIWMLRGVFVDVPKEVEEAAMLDGATRFQTVIRIILPMVALNIFSVSVLVFIFSWNEFLIPLIFTSTTKAMPVVVGVRAAITLHQAIWQNVAAAGVLATIPGIVLIFFLHKYIIKGLTIGLTK